MTTIIKKKFDALTNHELYQILRLRNAVFVVEQNAVYQDLDDLDQASTHYFITENDIVVAYIRTLERGLKFEDACSIGRVVTDKNVRHNGYARRLIAQGIKDLMKIDHRILIEGQAYLKQYYESFGFKVISNLYLVDGIDHYLMELTI